PSALHDRPTSGLAGPDRGYVSNPRSTLMDIIDHEREPLDQWRDGVMTRMRASALNGAHQLCLFEQFCEPGRGAPTHMHTVEEVLTVLSGQAEIWIGEERGILAQGQSVIVSPGQ